MKASAPERDSVDALWRGYLISIGEQPETSNKEFSAWHFCESREDANALVELVLSRTKCATTGALALQELDGESLPRVGALSVITDGEGTARCVIRSTSVDVLAFDDVDEEFAGAEGEGDGSLEHWRRVHWKFFEDAMQPQGLQPTGEMLVVCERFDVVHAPGLVDPRASWDEKAAGWDEQVGEGGDMNRRLNSDPVLWKFAGDVEGMRVLDAGCGTGYLSRELTRRGACVVGVDFSPAMIEIARRRAREQGLEIEHRTGDCSQLFAGEEQPLLPRAFDLAISNYVLMDLPDLHGAIQGLAQALVPGGVAIAIFSHPCFPQGVNTSVDEDPQSPGVSYRWNHNYFEAGAYLEEAWGRFTTAFPFFHRPLSEYFAAFRSAGFAVTDLEEPRLEAERAHLVAEDPRRLRRSQLLPYSIAFRLVRLPKGD